MFNGKIVLSWDAENQKFVFMTNESSQDRELKIQERGKRLCGGYFVNPEHMYALADWECTGDEAIVEVLGALLEFLDAHDYDLSSHANATSGTNEEFYLSFVAKKRS